MKYLIQKLENISIKNEYKKDDIIKCQSLIRRYLSNKNNIFVQFKKLQEKYKKEILGYHILNNESLKESRWEEINRNIVSYNYSISYYSNGNHKSGIDNIIEKWKISNKSAKVKNNMIDISSYRLTNVCDNKNIGKIRNIIDEIKKRDETFDYYSLLTREEYKNKKILYKWYIIPKCFYLFNVDNKYWEEKYSVKYKDKVIGWKCENMDITFSMSSQLWIHIKEKDIVKYKISEVIVDTDLLPKLTYSIIAESLLFDNST